MTRKRNAVQRGRGGGGRERARYFRFLSISSSRRKRKRSKRSSLRKRERAIVNQTNIGPVSKATLGKLPRDGMERIYGLSRVHIYHLELNWTKQVHEFELYTSYHISSAPFLTKMSTLFRPVLCGVSDCYLLSYKTNYLYRFPDWNLFQSSGIKGRVNYNSRCLHER